MTLRTAFLALSLSFAACAPAPQGPHARPVDVAAVRREIRDAIAVDTSPSNDKTRAITSMGHVTQDSAVVYTKTSSARFEETWVHQPTGWKLDHVTPVSG